VCLTPSALKVESAILYRYTFETIRRPLLPSHSTDDEESDFQDLAEDHEAPGAQGHGRPGPELEADVISMVEWRIRPASP
jgi:hypothetical protein